MGLLLAFAIASLAGPGWAQAPGNPKGKTGAKVPPKATPKPAEKFAQPDPEWLPPGFQPPPEPLAIMDKDLPLASKEELVRLKKEVGGKFSKVLRDCDQSAAGNQIVQSGIRLKLMEMTQPEKRKDLPELHRTLMREITTGIGNPASKPADVTSMTQYVSAEIVKQIPELLVNNFYVRLHAVLILSELDYSPAYVLLLQVIQAQDISQDPVVGQPAAVKIAAVQGLIRILRFAAPPVAQRSIIANAIVGELAKKDTHWWYQLRLIEALRYMTVSIDAGNNKPFVIDSLLAVITDAKRQWVVRCKACYAIGRVPVPAAVRPDDIVTAVADCALQLSTDAQAKPNNPIWKGCFWDVYLAFKSDGTKDKDGKERDKDAEGRNPGGLLARFKLVAQPAYDRIVPIARDAIHGNPPNPGDVKNLADFVRPRLPAAPAQKGNTDPAKPKEAGPNDTDGTAPPPT